MIITIVIINQQWWYGGLCVSATNFSMPNQPCMAFEHNFFFRAFYRELIDGIVAACLCLVVGRRPLPHTSILINVCFRWCRCIFGSQRIAINKEKKSAFCTKTVERCSHVEVAVAYRFYFDAIHCATAMARQPKYFHIYIWIWQQTRCALCVSRQPNHPQVSVFATTLRLCWAGICVYLRRKQKGTRKGNIIITYIYIFNFRTLAAMWIACATVIYGKWEVVILYYSHFCFFVHIIWANGNSDNE